MENMVNKDGFWKNKNVFITGHTGFKGGWLTLWLQSMGATVTGYALSPKTHPSLFDLAQVQENITHILGDIRDYDCLKNAIDAHQPEIIFHLAAQPLVRYSYQEPITTYSTNVMGTVNLLEAARHSPSVKVVINVTSDKCYENKEWNWGYRENDKLGGHDPYSNSKACSELVTEAYRNSYFHKDHPIKLASVRAGNVIGGGDWSEDRLIPDMMRAYLKQHPLRLRFPAATRPWQHVLEPVGAYLLLAEKLYFRKEHYAEAWNFGPEDQDIQTVDWIANRMRHLLDNQVEFILESNQQPHEACYLKLDCSKAKTRLPWQPKWNLEKSLKETVDWYKSYQRKENMRAVTLSQIKEFTFTS